MNVEITSYGLLALIEANQFSDGLPYFRWLLSQRNDQGGFEGTQDTVVGLQALARFAERISSKNNNVQIVVKSGQANETHINVNAENSLVLQTFEVRIPFSFDLITTSCHSLSAAIIDTFCRCKCNRSRLRSIAIIISIPFK